MIFIYIAPWYNVFKELYNKIHSMHAQKTEKSKKYTLM